MLEGAYTKGFSTAENDAGISLCHLPAADVALLLQMFLCSHDGQSLGCVTLLVQAVTFERRH